MFSIESSKNKDVIFQCDEEDITHHICDLLNKYSPHTTYSVIPKGNKDDIKSIPI
jgi:hypothetical protein